MSKLTASLPWYDLAEVRHATDTLWCEFARQMRRAGVTGVPGRLNRKVPYEDQWISPEFLFGQACGYDVRIAHANRLQVVATPRYSAAGCRGAKYSSYVVVREDAPFDRVEDLRGTRCVINTPTSHSGMNILRALVAPLHQGGRFFREVRMSGSHERSLRLIGRGEVDVAAIDCVTHALLERHRPQELGATRILHRTEHVPAPPYVTGVWTEPATLARMREAVFETLERPGVRGASQALLLSGVQLLPGEAYGAIEQLELMAEGHRYHEIPGVVVSAG